MGFGPLARNPEPETRNPEPDSSHAKKSLTRPLLSPKLSIRLP